MFWPVCFSEYLLKAEYSRGRYTDLNGDNDRAPAAGSQNQVGKKFGSIFLCLSFFLFLQQLITVKSVDMS